MVCVVIWISIYRLYSKQSAVLRIWLVLRLWSDYCPLNSFFDPDWKQHQAMVVNGDIRTCSKCQSWIPSCKVYDIPYCWLLAILFFFSVQLASSCSRRPSVMHRIIYDTTITPMSRPCLLDWDCSSQDPNLGRAIDTSVPCPLVCIAVFWDWMLQTWCPTLGVVRVSCLVWVVFSQEVSHVFSLSFLCPWIVY